MKINHSDITLTVDLGAIRFNYEVLHKAADGATCGAVVKANAYGLGVDKVAQALYSAGCRNFFVATADEAIQLTKILTPKTNIYVFHGVKRGEERDFVKLGLIPVINDFDQLDIWTRTAKAQNIKLPTVLHFDTGMNRLGFNWQDAGRVADDPHLQYLDLKLVMSHLSCIVEDEHQLNKDQLIRTNEVRKKFPGIPVSVANSKGIVAGKCYHFDMVRPGSALYGIRGSSKTLDTKHVVTATAKILQTRKILEDGFVGYGASHRITKDSRIAVCPLGYADGYIRSLSNNSFAFFGKHKVPLIGRVSMDMTIFDISAIPENEIKAGDELELIGENYKVDDIAKHAGTIGYEILTNLGCRYHRIYK